jgi:hypothetical protein
LKIWSKKKNNKCTDTEISKDSHYFDGKQFDFKGYELLSNVSSDVLTQNVPLFFSKIPLHQLSIYLNMKELQDMAILHKIYIPPRVKKKELLTYFFNHYCTHCDLYVSVLTEKKNPVSTEKRMNKNKNKKTEDSDLISTILTHS